MRMVFLSVTFVIGVVPVEPITITWGVVIEVLVIVKSRVVPPSAFDPSKIVLLFFTRIMGPEFTEPLIRAETPMFGLIVNVLVVLDPRIGSMTMGKVSPAEL